jgi:hypothetical protein
VLSLLLKEGRYIYYNYSSLPLINGTSTRISLCLLSITFIISLSLLLFYSPLLFVLSSLLIRVFNKVFII